MEVTASPSNCTYCYTLECSLRITSSNTSTKTSSISAKQAIVTVGRNSSRFFIFFKLINYNFRDILLQVEVKSGNRSQQALASYSLAECVVHSQTASQGKGCIEIPSRWICNFCIFCFRNLLIQLSNCPPRQINVFLKSLGAKLELMKTESDPKSNTRTPVSVAR